MSEQVTEGQLQQACREWQKRLRLQDWTVDVRFVGWTDFSRLGRVGECSHNLEHRWAKIDILRPEEYCEGSREHAPGRWEDALVHELIELHFAPFKECEGLERTAQEQAINAVAEALVALAREG